MILNSKKYVVNIIDEDNIGNGIAKIDNFVIFVKNALKDEILEIKINNIKKNYATAHITKFIEESKNRTAITCPNYEICGGCNFLHTTYQNELLIKQKYLEKLFNRSIPILHSNLYYNYRNKVTLHVINGKLGYFDNMTHN